VVKCATYEYADKFNKQCLPCDSSCLTCSFTSNTSCTSCPNGKFLYKATCLENCPSDYSENIAKQSCELIIPDKIYASLTEINNPYKFFLVFYSLKAFNLTIRNLRQELNLNCSINILDKRSFTYQITPSGLNSTSFFLEMNYVSKNLISSSLMTVSLEKSDTPFFEFITKNFTISLAKSHSCLSSQYFNLNSSSCFIKFLIDFSWSYGDQNDIIILSFNDLNLRILTAILYERLLIISIEKFAFSQDYTYILTNTSNSIKISFKFMKNVIGGVILHISLNQSIYPLINIANLTSQLLNRSYAIKLLQYYILSESEQATINNSATLSKASSQTSTAMYASSLLSPGTSFAIRGMLLMNIVQLLKYVDINYPPNVVAVFREDDSKLIFKENILDDRSDKIPFSFQLYKVSGSILNNLFDEFFQICLLIFFAIFFSFILPYSSLCKKNDIFDIILVCVKSIFIWSMVIMMLISKYLRVCVCLMLFSRYNLYMLDPLFEFFFAFFLLIYIIYLPIHLIFLIRKISVFPKEDNNQITPHLNNYSKNKVLPNEVLSLERTNYPLDEANNEHKTKEKMIKNKKIATDSNDGIFDFTQKQTYYDKNKPMKASNLNNTALSPELPPQKRHSLVDWTTVQKLNEDELNLKKTSVDWGYAGQIKEEDSQTNESDKRKITFFDKSVQEFVNEDLINYVEKKKNGILSVNIKFNGHNENKGLTENNEYNANIGKNENKRNYGINEEIAEILERKQEVLQAKHAEIRDFDLPVRNNPKKMKSNIWEKYCRIICFPFEKTCIYLFNSIQRVYKPHDVKEFSYRYRVLLKGLKKTKRINKNFFIFDLMRYFALAVAVSLFYDYPLMQICILESICLIFLIFLWITRPFEMKIDMYICLVNEGLINSAFISAVMLAIFDDIGYLDSDIRMKLGWSIVFTYLILMYSLLFNTFQRTVRLVFFVLCKLVENIKNRKKN